MMKNGKTKRLLSVILSVALIFTLLTSMWVYSASAEPASDSSTSAPSASQSDPTEPDFGEGEKGTAEAPFQIKDRADIEKLRDHVNAKDAYIVDGGDAKAYADAYYVLTADINLDGSADNEWNPIGRDSSGVSTTVYFGGVFDGQGHTISGLYINTSDEKNRTYTYGLFGYNSGTIKNLIVSGDMNVSLWNGMIAGRNTGTIENCATSGSLIGTYINGGIVGINRGGTVKNCYTTVALANNNSSFGIYGANYANVANDVTTDPVVKNTYYIDKLINGANIPGSTEPMSAEDFASGKVAWLLQNGMEETDTLVWEQSIGTDKLPKIHSTEDGDDGERVYQAKFMFGNTDTVLAETYVNDDDLVKDPALKDIDIDGYTITDTWYKNADKSAQWAFDSDRVNADTVIYSDRVTVEYEIKYDLNGGNDAADPNPTSYNVESKEIVLKAPTRNNDTFVGWTGTDITGSAQMEVTIPQGSTGNRSYVAHYYDNTAPNATITVGDNNWNYFDDTIEFDVFYNSTQTVTITATDNEDATVDEIWYYIANAPLSLQELESLGDAWIPYTSEFTINPPADGLVIYAKVSDEAGNTAYISTSGIVFDIDVPEIYGIDNDGRYCLSASFEVNDAYLASVTVDVEGALTENDGIYTINDNGTYVITATDKAGNTTVVNITIGDHVEGYVSEVNVLNPGCGTEGQKLIRTYCDICYQVIKSSTEIIPALEHNWTDWEIILMPSCDDEGTEQRTCLRCYTTETKNLKETGHNWDTKYTVDKKATCTAPGSQSIHCLNCSAQKESVEIPITNHNTSIKRTENEVAATCTTSGSYDTVYYCSTCRQEQRRTTVTIPASGHSFSDWETIVTPDCDDEGTLQRICSKCKFVDTKNLSPNGHTWDEDNWVLDQKATCTVDGSESIRCKVCQAVKESRTIPATGHTPAESPVKIVIVKATCESNGSYDMVDYCTVCNQEASREHFVEDALEHDFGNWYLIVSPECEDDGAERRDCSRCEVSETRGVVATGHDWETDFKIDLAPTCTTLGSESIHCKKCTAVKESTTIEPLGHDWSDWSVVKSPDCDDSGTKMRTCNKCKTTETEGLNPNGHDWNEDYTTDAAASCTTDGSKSIHCKNCSVTKNSEAIPATGHSYGEWVIIEAPTCQSTGIQQRVCATCGNTESAAIDATGNHEWEDEPRVDLAPSCTTDGSQSIHCKVCNISKDSEVIPMTGHTWGDWKTVVMPDCDDEGTQQRICEVCGTIETNGLVASGHEWPVDDKGETIYTIIDATCTTDGSKSVLCARCGVALASEVIPALGHDYVDGICSRCGESDGTAAAPEIIVDGTDNEYVLGSNTGASIYSSGIYKWFAGVSVDGKIVDEKYYTVSDSDGSTIVTFTPEFLDTLAKGDHNVTLKFTYGEVSTVLTVKAKTVDNPSTDNPAPKPSDDPAKDESTTKPSDDPAKDDPTTKPSDDPVKDEPTTKPSDEPTTKPSDEPTTEPSDEPATEPSNEPTEQPDTESPEGNGNSTSPDTGNARYLIGLSGALLSAAVGLAFVSSKKRKEDEE